MTKKNMHPLLSHSRMNSIPLTTDDDVTPEPNNFATRTLSTLKAMRSGGNIDTEKLNTKTHV